jgi:predicted nuclease of predicted toxin-antitoxin system
VKFKLDENLPVSSARLLAKSGHDVDTVAAAEARALITLDRGLGDLRAYPPGSHAGIVVLRLTDQSAPAVNDAITELANWSGLEALAGAVAVLQRGMLRIRHP